MTQRQKGRYNGNSTRNSYAGPQQMSMEQLLETAEEAGRLLGSREFQRFVEWQSLQLWQAFEATKPEEMKRREFIYLKRQALADLIQTLQEWLKAGQATVAEETERRKVEEQDSLMNKGFGLGS